MRSFIFDVIKNYLASGAATAVVSVTTVVESVTTATVSITTAVVSTATSSAGASAFLHDTTVKIATTAKLKNTFFILLNYKRLIINSGQRYKFFNR